MKVVLSSSPAQPLHWETSYAGRKEGRAFIQNKQKARRCHHVICWSGKGKIQPKMFTLEPRSARFLKSSKGDVYQISSMATTAELFWNSSLQYKNNKSQQGPHPLSHITSFYVYHSVWSGGTRCFHSEDQRVILAEINMMNVEASVMCNWSIKCGVNLPKPAVFLAGGGLTNLGFADRGSELIWVCRSSPLLTFMSSPFLVGGETNSFSPKRGLA